MTKKITETSNLSSNIGSCNKNVHENMHSNHTITNFDQNNNFENYENGNCSPTDLRKKTQSYPFVYSETISETISRSNAEPQLQVPLQNPICPNETSKGYSQNNSQLKDQPQRGCINLSLNIDFDIF